MFTWWLFSKIVHLLKSTFGWACTLCGISKYDEFKWTVCAAKCFQKEAMMLTRITQYLRCTLEWAYISIKFSIWPQGDERFPSAKFAHWKSIIRNHRQSHGRRRYSCKDCGAAWPIVIWNNLRNLKPSAYVNIARAWYNEATARWRSGEPKAPVLSCGRQWSCNYAFHRRSFWQQLSCKG